MGISVNTTFSQKAFADFTKIKFPLLAAGRDLDATRKVLSAYGVLDPKRGLARRSYVIIDKEGTVRFKSIRPSNREQDLLSTEALLNEVKKINQAS
ncbi:MAG: redoxin domain-containing protein [Deltaproteobacteria bacterium]|nr:redoxin domain-containing protein [Deltaproteobacteria bacterium]